MNCTSDMSANEESIRGEPRIMNHDIRLVGFGSDDTLWNCSIATQKNPSS